MEALKRLTGGKLLPRRRLRDMSQAVAYLVGDDSGLGFGLVMWFQSRLALYAGDFILIYQGKSSNFREG